MPSTPPPGRKYFTFFTLDTVLQSAFLFALSAFVHILGVSAGRPNRRVVSLDDELRLGFEKKTKVWRGALPSSLALYVFFLSSNPQTASFAGRRGGVCVA